MVLEFAVEPTIFLSVFSGIIVGFTLGLIGGGGSVLAVPLLLYVVGVRDVHVAIGTSALAVGVIAAINLFGHKRKGNLKIKKGIMFTIPGIIGSVIGAHLGLLTPPENLLLFFAVFMGIIALMMLRRKVSRSDIVKTSGSTVLISKNKIAPSGFFVGMMAGYFGIGGGFLIVPSLMYFGSLSITQAIGTSLMAVSAFGLTTASSYFISGNVDVIATILFVIGGAFGGIIGIRITDKIPKIMLTRVFAILLFVVSGYIILRSLLV